MNDSDIKRLIRTVRDWPKPGVNFRDVSTLFQNAEGFRACIDLLSEKIRPLNASAIAGIDARGFIIGGALAYQLRLPFLLVRKKGKLPHATISANYQLEYGSATIELHRDAAKPGDRIVIVDDLIATGGTLLAAANLFQQIGAQVVGVTAAIDLPQLGGSKRLRDAGLNVFPLCVFSESE